MQPRSRPAATTASLAARARSRSSLISSVMVATVDSSESVSWSSTPPSTSGARTARHSAAGWPANVISMDAATRHSGGSAPAQRAIPGASRLVRLSVQASAASSAAIRASVAAGTPAGCSDTSRHSSTATSFCPARPSARAARSTASARVVGSSMRLTTSRASSAVPACRPAASASARSSRTAASVSRSRGGSASARRRNVAAVSGAPRAVARSAASRSRSTPAPSPTGSARSRCTAARSGSSWSAARSRAARACQTLRWPGPSPS